MVTTPEEIKKRKRDSEIARTESTAASLGRLTRDTGEALGIGVARAVRGAKAFASEFTDGRTPAQISVDQRSQRSQGAQGGASLGQGDASIQTGIAKPVVLQTLANAPGNSVVELPNNNTPVGFNRTTETISGRTIIGDSRGSFAEGPAGSTGSFSNAEVFRGRTQDATNDLREIQALRNGFSSVEAFERERSGANSNAAQARIDAGLRESQNQRNFESAVTTQKNQIRDARNAVRRGEVSPRRGAELIGKLSVGLGTLQRAGAVQDPTKPTTSVSDQVSLANLQRNINKDRQSQAQSRVKNQLGATNLGIKQSEAIDRSNSRRAEFDQSERKLGRQVTQDISKNLDRNTNSRESNVAAAIGAAGGNANVLDVIRLDTEANNIIAQSLANKENAAIVLERLQKSGYQSLTLKQVKSFIKSGR